MLAGGAAATALDIPAGAAPAEPQGADARVPAISQPMTAAAAPPQGRPYPSVAELEVAGEELDSSALLKDIQDPSVTCSLTSLEAGACGREMALASL